VIKRFSEILESHNKEKISGCFIDTSVLVAATYDLDLFHDVTSSAFDLLAELKIPTFSNINVRSEYLEQQRRILFPECLCDFLQDFNTILDERLLFKLQSHRNNYRRKIENKQSAKMDAAQIASFCDLLAQFSSEKTNGLDAFSQNYFIKRFFPVWSFVTQSFDMTFISIRSNDKNEFLNSTPTWEEATAITGRHCQIGFNDSMILNMFLCSKIPVLITADLRMAQVAELESKGEKIIFVPDLHAIDIN